MEDALWVSSSFNGARPRVYDMQQDSDLFIPQQDLNPLRLERLAR